MVVNCNSLVSNRKQALFSQRIDDHKPDVGGGCESTLDNTIKSEEVFQLTNMKYIVKTRKKEKEAYILRSAIT